MYDFTITLMGSEEAILDYLGIPHNYKDYLKVVKKQDNLTKKHEDNSVRSLSEKDVPE